MNLAPEEQILIKDIFAVTVNPADNSVIYLPQFSAELAVFGNNASLVEHSTYFDSLLMERLQVPQTQILAYLEDSWARAQQAKDKPWNSSNEARSFIDYSIEIVKNFIMLSLQQSEIFPEQLIIDENAAKANTKSLEVAMKLLTHFERRGFSSDLLQVVVSGLDQEFYQDFLQVLLARQRFQTVLQPKAFLYLSLLVDLLGISEFRQAFTRLKGWAFLPKEVSKIQGSLIDIQSPFGIFMRLSVLGQNPGHYHQQNQAVNRFQERMIAQLGSARLTKQKLKFYTNLQNEFYSKLTQCYKLLLKKQTQKQFMQWNYGVLVGNISKIKLGARLYNANTNTVSHDGLLLNSYACFLNLCRVITSRQDQKYLSIDPNYFKSNQRVALLKYDPINSRPFKKSDEKRQFGTITEFFFMCIQFLHIGVCGAMQNFNQLNQLKKNLQKEVGRLTQNHPLYKKAQYEIAKTQSKLVRYFAVILQDQTTINSTIKLLDLLLELLPGWLGFDYEQLQKAHLSQKGSELIYYLPQMLLTVVCKYHTTNYSYKQGYLSIIGEQHLMKILETTCFLLSDQEIVTNPYIAANYVELLFMFLHDSKAGIMYEVFKSSTVALSNLTLGLIRFYCSIAITGRSNQFYEKFKYRYEANKIFTSLWTQQAYRSDLKNYFNSPLFQKFLNMVMTDTTYCFDQTNENYEKFKQLEVKKTQGPLSEEDLKNQEMVERVIGSTLNQSTSNLKLMRDLSAWSPQTFLTEVDRVTAVPLLNNIIKTFVDPGAFTSNRQLLSKFKFESGPALADLVQIYANLSTNDNILSNQIVKDSRNYKKQYFSKALQKASNEHYTSIDILQKFQGLINKLTTAQNEEENEEIYGEIPDKYLCSLMSTLMKDPVLLPGSGNVVDRVTIHRSLLTDERDPFTRQPLKEKDLIPQIQLREEIEVWKKHRLEQLKKGGKELKYGKIAETYKKQGGQSQVFGNNPVIEEE